MIDKELEDFINSGGTIEKLPYNTTQEIVSRVGYWLPLGANEWDIIKDSGMLAGSYYHGVPYDDLLDLDDLSIPESGNGTIDKT